MITEARIDNLLRCVRNNEEAEGFDLAVWIQPCGTYGCLVGNDFIATHSKKEFDDFDDFSLWAKNEYGLSPMLVSFLFASWNCKRTCYGGPAVRVDCAGAIRLNSGHEREHGDRDAALNRLRKFAYYVLRKRELLYDDSGRIRETARRTEGDHHVLRAVKSAVERKERELATV